MKKMFNYITETKWAEDTNKTNACSTELQIKIFYSSCKSSAPCKFE